MRDLKTRERAAIEGVARRCLATWENESDSCDVYVTIAGKRVAVGIKTLKQHGVGRGKGAKPRLRFDKVVIRLAERLRTTLGKTVPDGTTVLWTITAPIRLASKTAGALEEKVQDIVGRRSDDQDEKDTIQGNRVRIRVLRNRRLRGPKWRPPKMIGFVHNPDTNPLLFFDMTSELLELFSAEAEKRTARLGYNLVKDRWLIVISARGSSCLEAYRYIYSQLGMAGDFRKVFMKFGDGRVEPLTE